MNPAQIEQMTLDLSRAVCTRERKTSRHRSYLALRSKTVPASQEQVQKSGWAHLLVTLSPTLSGPKLNQHHFLQYFKAFSDWSAPDPWWSTWTEQQISKQLIYVFPRWHPHIQEEKTSRPILFQQWPETPLVTPTRPGCPVQLRSAPRISNPVKSGMSILTNCMYTHTTFSSLTY